MVGAALGVGTAGCAGNRADADSSATGTPESTPMDTASTSTPVATGTDDPSTPDETGTPTSAATTRPTLGDPVSINSGDLSIEGTLYGDAECAVVLVPQINLDRGSWESQAVALVEAGYQALAIDEDPDRRAASVTAAVEYLRSAVGTERVVLVGASSGGEAVVRANAAADPGTIAGTIALSPAGGVDVAGELQGRLLFVVCEGDADRFVRTARRLHRDAPEPERLVTFGGDDHGQEILAGEHGETLWSHIRSTVERGCATE